MEASAAEKLELGELTVHDEQKILAWNTTWKKCHCERKIGLGGNHSEWTRIGGYLWRLEANHTSGNSSFRVVLQCNWPVDDRDSFEVEATLLTASVPETKQATFNHSRNTLAFARGCEAGQIRVIVQVKKPLIKLLQEEIADVTFVIEDQELQSSSKRLIKASPVFASMLEGGFAEAESKRITIEDATFEEFSSFIGALLDGGSIAANNVEALYMLSDKYDTADLLQRCREFVWKSGMDVLQKFVVAEKWDDGRLLKKLTGEIADSGTLKKLEAGGMMTQLKPSTVSLILKKGFSLI